MKRRRSGLAVLISFILSISMGTVSPSVYAEGEEVPENISSSETAEDLESIAVEEEAENDSEVFVNQVEDNNFGDASEVTEVDEAIEGEDTGIVGQLASEEELTIYDSAEAMSEAPKAIAATAPSSLWLDHSETNNIPSRIDVFKSSSKYQLYLPGNANLDECYLSWDSDGKATVDGYEYESGSCPVPPVNTEKTYTFKSGNTTLATFKITTYQGSESVTPVFIDIDETYVDPEAEDDYEHSIYNMDNDSAHDKYCVGNIYIAGTKYGMPKIKGRGNYTWKMSDDKRAYNITLDKKIKFPGIDSEKTKKWSILSEVGDHSLLCNRSGFYLAHEMGIGLDTASADVWMNGEYQGCYTVTPKYDSFVTKDGYLIENDNYQETVSVADGGDPQFALDGLYGSNKYNNTDNLITVKKIGDNLLTVDGEVDESAANVAKVVEETIHPWLQDAWDAIRSDTGYNDKGKYYTDYIDIESFAKMYLMHEYVKSYDICAGSILFHRDGITDADKLIAGPLWDLDNALGSTQGNADLGDWNARYASNRVVDRRSGQGEFITKIKEYKTSIYKTLGKHEDFMEEVRLQYNKYYKSFDNLANDVQTELINNIADSAKMNHNKVNDITNYNLHKYSSATTLGSGVYTQNMLATTNSKTDWANYAENLITYITTRSLWFKNTYYDTSYINILGISTDSTAQVAGDISHGETGVITAKVSSEDIGRYSTTAYPTTSLKFKDDKGEHGYLFAGWYKDAAGTDYYTEMPTTEAYAKFVNADLLAVKYQVPVNAKLTDETMTIRLLATVDSLDYANLGIRLEREGKDPIDKLTTKVYTYILVTDDQGNTSQIQPEDLTMNSKYIYALKVNNVPKEYYNKDLVLKAYWTTYDGTKVTGEARTTQIKDHKQFQRQ